MDEKSKKKQLFKLYVSIIGGRIVKWFLKKWRREKHIRLAVVGTTSSGKSFLLMDIIQSLRDLGFPAYDSKNDDSYYKDIADYKPDEGGGYGGTPFYACRQDNLYVGEMGRDKGFVLDFLNIPGETFSKHKGQISRVDAYNNLRGALQKNSKKIFSVITYVEKDTDDIKLIVEPRKNGPISSGTAKASTVPIDDDSRKTTYLSWEDIIARELKDYEPVKGLTKHINGKTLLKHFFEYQTDSVIRSIEDLINSGDIQDVGFNGTAFVNNYDKAFVFLHYCTNATDIVLCDRIMPIEDSVEEITFGELSNGISQFIDRNNKTTQVYLAFRYADYMLYEKEKAYINLNDTILKRVDREKKRNAIYSIFHSSMLHHIYDGLQEKITDYEYFVGLDHINGFKKEELLSQHDKPIEDFVNEIANEYVDFNGCNKDFEVDAADLADYITSRFGGLGNAQAFRGLLQMTGVDAQNDEIVPHVYFTCTPITSNYKIYHNYKDENGKMAPDFKRVDEDGDELYFREQSSQACFGSFQLCMDILNHHELKQFKQGSLLRHLQGNMHK